MAVAEEREEGEGSVREEEESEREGSWRGVSACACVWDGELATVGAFCHGKRTNSKPIHEPK